MQRRLFLSVAGLMLASTSTLVFAETVRGPAGSIELPNGITGTVAPSNLVHPDIDRSAIITLNSAQFDANRPVTVEMSCAPAIGPLDSATGMERLAAATFHLDKKLKREKGEWIKFGPLQAYRTDASRVDGTRLTQWMIPLVTSFAWVKFNRPSTAPMEQDVLNAVAAMKILCGPFAEDKKSD